MKLFDVLARTLPDDQPPALDRPRRRDVLSPAAVWAAMWAAASRADPPSRGTDPRLWLIRHLTFGFTEAELAQADALGDDGYLEYQLDYSAIDDSALDQRLAAYSTLTMEPYELAPLPAGQVIGELVEATILRSVFSRRQLFERMVEFWTDHFNIDINNGADRWLKTVDDRDVIRAHALGTFPALLSASAHSPAMLFYLDNVASVVGNPNENYARELMELHTLGVDGGYTQQDVVEVARCFTGWGIYPVNSGTDTWTFRFMAARHDNAQKVVLGQVIPAGGGITDGETVLDILAHHPSTAAFIARKLCERFWGYEPPQTLVDAVAATYTSTGGDIKSMLRTLFSSPEAAQLPLKYKRPYHQFVSALRATGASITTTTAMRQTQLTAAGHVPFAWSPPDGYPDTLDYWAGLILPRWNFGAALLNGNVNGLSVNIDGFLAGANTAQAVMDRIDAAMFGGTMAVSEKDRIRDYLLPDPPTTTRKRDAVGLAIGSPGFQWY